MDVNDDYVTMLTPDGEFVKAKCTKMSYEIGEEITSFPLDGRARNASKPRFFQVRKWRYALASSLVAILFLSLFIPFSSRDEVYAYMSIDINPSFEVGLDENLQVISLEALNDEAKKLLESIPDWKNSTLDSITEKIIENSKDSGYLKDGKQVLITTVVTDSHDTEVDRELEQGIEEIKEEYKKEQIAVTSITSTVETRKAAQEKGISTGKLLIEEDKVPKPVEEQKATPARQEKKENQKGKAVEQKEINEFRNNQKQKAEEVQEELIEKKEQIKEKVKNNIENSNMPAHLKEKKIEKIEEKWEKKQQKQEEKERKKEEREQRKENNNRGKDRNHDHDDD
jgi:Anti-sigma factor N-terminus